MDQINNNTANVTPEQIAELKIQQKKLTENLNEAKKIIDKNIAFVTQLKNKENQLEKNIANLKKENETLKIEKNSIPTKLQANKKTWHGIVNIQNY